MWLGKNLWKIMQHEEELHVIWKGNMQANIQIEQMWVESAMKEGTKEKWCLATSTNICSLQHFFTDTRSRIRWLQKSAERRISWKLNFRLMRCVPPFLKIVTIPTGYTANDIFFFCCLQRLTEVYQSLNRKEKNNFFSVYLKEQLFWWEAVWAS